ncbi:MAG: hypothetical protein AAFX87_02760 [Bacteroidota bacterium]
MQDRKYYQIDFDQLVAILLPGFLRKPKLTAFLKACIAPMKTLYDEFQIFQKRQAYEAGITAQAGLIEKALNDSFDHESRRFQIVHELLNDGPTLYLDSDMKEDRTQHILHLDEEGHNSSGLFMHLSTESSELPAGVDFRVNAPLDTSSREEAIKSVVRKYKFAAKTFDVEFR